LILLLCSVSLVGFKLFRLCVMRALLIYHVILILILILIHAEIISHVACLVEIDNGGTHIHLPSFHRFLNGFLWSFTVAPTVAHLVDVSRRLSHVRRTLLLRRLGHINDLLTSMVHHRYQLHLTVLNVHLLFNDTPKGL
jgi:hypothetical protein